MLNNKILMRIDSNTLRDLCKMKQRTIKVFKNGKRRYCLESYNCVVVRLLKRHLKEMQKEKEKYA